MSHVGTTLNTVVTEKGEASGLQRQAKQALHAAPQGRSAVTCAPH